MCVHVRVMNKWRFAALCVPLKTRHTPQLRPASKHTWCPGLHKPKKHSHYEHTHTRTHTVDADTAGPLSHVSVHFHAFLALQSLTLLRFLFSFHLTLRVLKLHLHNSSHSFTLNLSQPSNSLFPIAHPHHYSTQSLLLQKYDTIQKNLHFPLNHCH